jgi:hypothetical protein
MDIGAIFLILAVTLLAGLFISRPFTDQMPHRAAAPNQPGADESERSSLLAEYERQLNALQEMDFDHRMGKIPDEDYPQQRQAVLTAAAELLHRLDASEPTVPPAPDSPAAQAGDNGRSVEERVAEALIARPLSITAGDDLEALIAARRRARQEKASGFCPACGKPVQESDRFCPKCGARL